jgi:hypothetical protein
MAAIDKVVFALVCASNQNRSMEAHARLLKHGYHVFSYGTGAHVKLPGPARDKPNIYAFGTPYKQMYEELKEQNYSLCVSLFSLHLSTHLLTLSKIQAKRCVEHVGAKHEDQTRS